MPLKKGYFNIHGDIHKSRCTTGNNKTGTKFITGTSGDTGGKFATGINTNSGKFATGAKYTGGK
jgi:hypothetical protein